MDKLKSVFGKKKPLKEILRENKRTITRAVRDIDREKANLEKQEKKLVGEIKKNAKAGQMGAVKVRTGRTRHNVLLLFQLQHKLLVCGPSFDLTSPRVRTSGWIKSSNQCSLCDVSDTQIQVASAQASVLC